MANTVEKVLKIALAEVGYLEKSKSAYQKDKSVLDRKTDGAGYDNYTKYGRDMHQVYPSVMDFPAYWCDSFVDWCFNKAYGVATAKSLLGGNYDDYTVASAQMYKKKGAYHKSNPKIGDQIFFNNGKRICHTGLVYSVDGTYVYTVEGNTSGASGVIANGGGVCKKKYPLNYSRIDGYGRPKYDVETYSSTYITTSSKGLRVNASELNIRKTPNGELTGKTYKNGQCIQVKAKAFINKDPWVQVIDGNWVSAKYLTGWVQEDNDRWWYLLDGYMWHKDTVVAIDGHDYIFGGDGYMVTGWVKRNNYWMYSKPDGVVVKSDWIKDADGSYYYLDKNGHMATNAYIKSKDKDLYYWVNKDGVWEDQYDTPNPDLTKFAIVE